MRVRPEAAILLLLAGGCGISPALHGLYPLSLWGPAALVLLTLLVSVTVAQRSVPRGAALVALGGLVALWAWAALSIGWAESADQALIDSSRLLLYAAFFALLLMLLRDDRLAMLLLAAASVAILAFAAYLCVRLALPGSPDLFLGGRLNYPLGYVNGQAGYMLLALWPLVAVAERSRSPIASGAALAAAVVLVGLVLLAQSRAVVPAAVVSIAVLLIAVPGRRRRCWALLALAAGVAVAAGPLLDVYGTASLGARRPDSDTVRFAVLVLLAVAAATGAAWGSLRRAVDRSTARGGRGRLRAASTVALAAVAVVAIGGGVAAMGNPLEEARDDVRAFKRLDVSSTNESSSRFASGGGNRYDYWRIALDQFGSRPLAGLGVGNYDRTYFAERRTTEDIRQPHSLPLQTLAELGLVGGLALALFLGGVLAGFARRARLARGSEADLALAVAGGGTFLVWLVHTSVDWLHLLPGVTGIALCGAAVLVAPSMRGGGVPSPAARIAMVAVACAVALVGSILVGSTTLADRHTAKAQELVAADPRAALDEVDDALALNDESLPAYYARAAAYARLNDYRRARAALLDAAAREPSDYVPWGLMGDLAVRRGSLRQARRAYARASTLNPRDDALRRLARAP